MNDTTPRPPNSGDTKLSEIAVDRGVPFVTGSAPQDNALVTTEIAFRAITELARRQNYILRSEFLMQWTGTEIRFDADSQANNVLLEVLASEGSTNPAFTVRMIGSMAANAPLTFLNLPLDDGDLLYLELDSTLIVDQGLTFDLANAVNGGGVTPGMRVLKSPMTTAMPKLQIGISGGGSIFYIPLALRRGTDIFWIPHGIRWPAGTTSGLGAVIVEGIEAYPERFVENQTDLLTAIGDLGPQGGGVILVIEDFTIDQVIAIPVGVKLMGRGKTKYTIDVLNGGGFTMAAKAEMHDLELLANAAFTGTMVAINGDKAKVSGVKADITATSNVATNRAFQFDCSWSRLYDCEVTGVTAFNRVGVYYNTGSNNADVDTRFA